MMKRPCPDSSCDHVTQPRTSRSPRQSSRWRPSPHALRSPWCSIILFGIFDNNDHRLNAVTLNWRRLRRALSFIAYAQSGRVFLERDSTPMSKNKDETAILRIVAILPALPAFKVARTLFSRCLAHLSVSNRARVIRSSHDATPSGLS